MVSIRRDHETEIEDANQRGMEWQLKEKDVVMLFHETRVPQYPEQCKLPNVKGHAVGNAFKRNTSRKENGQIQYFMK